MNLALMLRSAVQAHPDNIAVTDCNKSLTYGEMWNRVLSLGAAFADLGLHKGDRVALFMDNCPEYLQSFFAIFSRGLCVVPLNSQFTTEEVRYHLEDSGSKILIHNARLHDVATQAVKSLEHPPVQILVSDGEPSEHDVLAYGALVQDHQSESLPLEDVHADDLAWLFYTSGTTGRPKGAMLTSANVSAVIVSWMADLMQMDSTSVTLHTAPLSHAAGFHALSSLCRGGKQVLLGHARFDPGSFLSVVAEHGVTDTWMVPTQVNRITRFAAFDRDLIPSLRHIVYGGAPFSLPDLIHALRTIGPILIQIYGQGETPMTATVLTSAEHAHALDFDESILSTAGRVRLGVEVRTVDEEDRATSVGVPGEIVVRGPTVMAGYWQRPDATAVTLRDGWLHTGDVGVFDDRGYLKIIDRLKDLIITGGSNVYAREIEDVLLALPGVQTVAVIGLPDSEWGEKVTAVVVLEPDVALDSDTVIVFCKERLAGYKVPKRVVFLDEMPLTSYGKISKRVIRDHLLNLDEANAT